MAAKKYLEHDGAGSSREVAATQASAGAADGGKIVALDDQGRLDPTVLPTGVGADTQTVLASEALAAGDLVNIYNNSGTANVRKADASNAAKEAHGYVKSGVANGAQALVYFEGNNDAASGMTPGRQFLSATTPGKTTTTAPTTAGHIVQRVGIALTAGVVNVELEAPITLA